MGDVTGLGIRGVDFEAIVTLEAPDAPALRLIGNADGSSVEPLQALVAELHRALVDAHTRRLRVEIGALEFMSAGCFNVFVSWLGLILALPPTERYQLVFYANVAIPWQRRSLHTLSCFATDLVAVESAA